MRLIVVTQESEPRAFGPFRSWKAAFRVADWLALECDTSCLLVELERVP